MVELGPGTGAVTRAIRERGIADCDLIAIESDPQFVAVLRAQFPKVRIIEDNAFRFRDILGEQARDLRSIVCGLPVVGRPAGVRRKLVDDAISSLRTGAPFIQFSYSIGPPIPIGDAAKAKRVATVWQNVPPMHIWVYRTAR